MSTNATAASNTGEESNDASAKDTGNDPAPSATEARKEDGTENASAGGSPYVVRGEQESESGTADSEAVQDSSGDGNGADGTPKVDLTTSQIRKMKRRLSFADEMGGQLSTVTYHENLHYAQIATESSEASRSGSTQSKGCCIIS